ncbi:MAG: DUF4129 domain-containing protein [Saprospiraceae bacterium]|nr:DUF4129 domain-containing protein [Saprospiraceae bacterium]
MPRYFILIFICMFASSLAEAQSDEPLPPQTPNEAYSGKRIERHDFDEEKWEALKDGIDYSIPKEKKKRRRQKGKEAKEVELPSQGLTGFGPILKIVGIVVLLGLLVLLIVKMASGENLFGPKNSKLRPAVSQAELDKIEENLHEAELKDPIQRAIAAGDYPMAVRLYYLAVLKELSVKNHIRWKRDKTNGAYLRELAGSPLFGTVQEVTLIFERVWYGKVELAKPDFDQLEVKLKKAVATASA